MAIFFGISGGLTAIGPIAGGYLTEWTWRSIFWINIPVAIIALFLTWNAKPDDDQHPAAARLPRHGAGHRRRWACSCSACSSRASGAGAAPRPGSASSSACCSLVAFVALTSCASPNPLLRLRIFRDRAFAVDNVVLFLLSIAFVPFFFFASVYAQVSLGESASEAGLYLLFFFAGFVIAAQFGGRILDQRGARPAGRARLRGRRGRLLPAGGQADRPLAERTVVLHRARRRRASGWCSARPAPTRSTARPSTQLQRGDRDHPDRAQLRRQPRPRGPRRDPDQPEQDERHRRADQGRRPARARPPGRGLVRPSGAPAAVRRRGQSARARPRRPARVRPLDPDDLLHHGRGDGGDVHRRGPRAAARPRGAAGSARHRAPARAGAAGPVAQPPPRPASRRGRRTPCASPTAPCRRSRPGRARRSASTARRSAPARGRPPRSRRSTSSGPRPSRTRGPRTPRGRATRTAPARSGRAASDPTTLPRRHTSATSVVSMSYW